MAGISKKKYKTKNGIVIKYVITHRDIQGKQHTTGNYSTKKEARLDLYKYEQTTIKCNNPTFGEIIELFMQKVRRKYADNTIKNYENYIKKYIIQFKDLKYKKLDSILFQKLFDEIEENSPYVAEICLKICKSAVNYSIRHKLITNNIFNQIEKIKPPKATLNHLNSAELINILDKCKNFNVKFYPLLFLFIGSGMREGEIFALEKEDLNYKDFTITINKQYTGGKLKYKPKTDTSNRTIHIFPILSDILKEHIKKLSSDNNIMFPNEAGNYLNPSNVRERWWKPLLKHCGYKKRIRLHDLRGSYIDLLLSNSLSGKFAQSQAGHSKWETTYNIYAQNNDDMIKSAQNQINNIFDKDKNKKCEHNVSKNELSLNKKIIQFPKLCQ